jgi:hypothetical protein
MEHVDQGMSRRAEVSEALLLMSQVEVYTKPFVALSATPTV